MLRILRIVAMAAFATASACSSTDTSEPRLIPIEQTSFAASLGVNLAASTKTANGAYYRDITVGTGATVANGKLLTVRYTGWLANGTQFDSNTSAAGFQFTLGNGRVIAGWEEGLQGVRVGGNRQLIIPASLGYGNAGIGPIPGNAVIVFNVEVVSAQ